MSRTAPRPNAVTSHYLEVIDRIRATRLPSEISVKLTQLGLDLDREFCFANLVEADRAFARGKRASSKGRLDRHGAKPLRGRHA